MMLAAKSPLKRIAKLNVLEAVALGVVQGLTEFLPVSSTAHLVLVPWFLHWPDPGLTFDVALHLGTFLAVAWFFWDDLTTLARAWFKSLRSPDLRNDPMQQLAWFVLAGTVPAAIAGVVLQKKIETTFRSPYIIAGTMIGVALLLALAELLGKRERDIKKMTLVDAIAVGCAQMCALIPGTSRSGSTITTAMGLGLTREAAARFSFLLGTPIIFGSFLFKTRSYTKAFKEQTHLHGAAMYKALGAHLAHSPNTLPFLAGVVASTVVGYFCIRFLMAFLQKRSMWVFIGYRLALGAIILVLILTHVLPAEMDFS